jgi:WD40 repeat protein
MSQSTKRVFLSYGTRDAIEVAMWLHGALTSRGYQVFWDKEGLRETTGSAWDRHLEEAIRTHDVVVALMSPHSVRPEGECRNEISFAKDLGKPIVPVMVRQCERPLRVHDLQYVDLEAFPRVGELERSAWLEEIIRFIENGVPVDPALSELRRRFRPLDYERVLRRNPTDPFTGREWLFDRIDQWIANPDAPSTLFVVAGPGVGKTSAVAHWCRGRLKVGAYHFCDHAQPDTARDVVASLAGQLLSLQALHPSYPEALRVLGTAGRDSSDTSSGSRDWTAVEWFRKLVLDPLRHDPPETPWVLVIDALDEALPEVRKMLRECHGELPSMVRLLITSRPDRDLVAWFRGALEIDASSEDNQRDLRQYVEDRLHLLKAAGRIESASDIVDRFAGRLVDASAGTFLYCAEVLDSIAAGHRAVSDDTVLPEGLGGVYAEFLGRNFPDPEGSAYRELRAALEVALGAKQTVDDRFIGTVLDIDEDDVADLRRSLGSLMVSGIEWRFFHKSLADWLGDGEASSYGVRPGRGVRRILKALDVAGGVLQKYALRWRVAHLIDEGKLEQACALLTDFSLLKSRVEAGLVRGVLEDMDTLLGAASGAAWPVPETLRVWQRLFRRRREFWEQFPEEFHQDCLNEAEGLPTTESAKANPINKPWIRWVNKPEQEIRQPWEWMVRDASCAAFSPDGKSVAVGGRSLRLIDAETGYDKWRVSGNWYRIESLAFSQDGSKLMTASGDRTARVWDTVTGKELLVLKRHGSHVGSVVFSPDGSKLLTALEDNTARVWDAFTGAELLVLKGHEGSVKSAEFSPDSSKLLTASKDNTARVWDAFTGAELLVLKGHETSVTSAIFSPDGTRILTQHTDCSAHLWDSSSGRELLELEAHYWTSLQEFEGAVFRSLEPEGWLSSAVFSPDGLRVLTVLSDKTARIWDGSSGDDIMVLQGHQSDICAAVFSPDGLKVLTVSSDFSIRIWGTSTGSEQLLLPKHEHRIESAMFSPNGFKVLTVSSDFTARCWDGLSDCHLLDFDGHERKVSSVEFSSDGSRVLTTATEEKTCLLWDSSSGIEPKSLRGHNKRIVYAVVSPDGSKALTASWDMTARIWVASTGTELATLKGHEHFVYSGIFSPDGSTVLTVSADKTARIWDASNGKELLVLKGHDGSVTSGVFSPDGTKVLTSSSDRTARLWDSLTGAELFVFRDHEAGLKSATFSPDGLRVLTCSGVKTASIWDASSGVPLLVIHWQIGSVKSAVFSSDGSKVLTVSSDPWDRTTRVWDTSSGAELACLPIKGFFSRAVSYQDSFELVDSSGETLYRWEYGTQISDSDIPFECPMRPTLIGYMGHTGMCLRVRGFPGFNPPALHLETKFESHVHPNDPLSFVAGCADGSVRFFRLEGVELPGIP